MRGQPDGGVSPRSPPRTLLCLGMAARPFPHTARHFFQLHFFHISPQISLCGVPPLPAPSEHSNMSDLIAIIGSGAEMAAPTPPQCRTGAAWGCIPPPTHPNTPHRAGCCPTGVCKGSEEEKEEEEEGPFLPPQPQNLEPPSALSIGNPGCYRAGCCDQRIQGGCAGYTPTWTWTQRGQRAPMGPAFIHGATGSPLDLQTAYGSKDQPWSA